MELTHDDAAPAGGRHRAVVSPPHHHQNPYGLRSGTPHPSCPDGAKSHEQNAYLAKHCIVCKQYLPDPKSLKQHLRKKHPATAVPEAAQAVVQQMLTIAAGKCQHCQRKVISCYCLRSRVSSLLCAPSHQAWPTSRSSAAFVLLQCCP